MQKLSALRFKSSFYHCHLLPFPELLSQIQGGWHIPFVVFSHKLNSPQIFPILLAVSKEVPKLAGKNMVMDLQQEDFIKLKGTRKLFH